MSRGQLMAMMAALAMGGCAPRLAAQDTSATRETRPDTSGYNGTAWIDTTAQPGRVGALDSTGVGLDSMRGGADTMAIPGTGSDSSSTDSSSASDSASVSQPTKQPGQNTSRTGDSASSTGP